MVSQLPHRPTHPNQATGRLARPEPWSVSYTAPTHIKGLGLDSRQQSSYSLTMQPTPIYQPANLNPAYQLRFSWTGFPASGTRFPADVSLDEMDELTAAWESDGIRVLEHRWAAEQIQATLSVVPQVSPIFLAARVKGRLQHAMRGNAAHSPEEIALRLQNNTAWKLGQVKFWEHNYYAGTFGEYTMHAVRS